MREIASMQSLRRMYERKSDQKQRGVVEYFALFLSARNDSAQTNLKFI